MTCPNFRNVPRAAIVAAFLLWVLAMLALVLIAAPAGAQLAQVPCHGKPPNVKFDGPLPSWTQANGFALVIRQRGACTIAPPGAAADACAAELVDNPTDDPIVAFTACMNAKAGRR